LPEERADPEQQKQTERPQPRQPDYARQLAPPVRCQRLRRLLRHHHLQRHARHKHRHRQQHAEDAVFRRRDFFVQQVNRVHHGATADIRNHQPAALPEKMPVRRGRRRGSCFNFFCRHECRKIRNRNGSGKRIQIGEGRRVGVPG